MPYLLSVFLALCAVLSTSFSPKTACLLSWLRNLLVPKLLIAYKKLFCEVCMLRVQFYVIDGRWLLKGMVLLLPFCLASGNLGCSTHTDV